MGGARSFILNSTGLGPAFPSRTLEGFALGCWLVVLLGLCDPCTLLLLLMTLAGLPLGGALEGDLPMGAPREGPLLACGCLLPTGTLVIFLTVEDGAVCID